MRAAEIPCDPATTAMLLARLPVDASDNVDMVGIWLRLVEVSDPKPEAKVAAETGTRTGDDSGKPKPSGKHK